MDSVEHTIRMNNLSKELRKYGFADSSQEAIAQASSIYGGEPAEARAEVDTINLTRAQFSEIINKMQRLWIFKDSSDQKLSVVADQLVKVTDKLNEVIKSISMIEMNQAVFDKKLNHLKEKGVPAQQAPSQQSSSSVQERGAESSHREKERLDHPIDRNGVAPEDVSIDKIFYCGNKR